MQMMYEIIYKALKEVGLDGKYEPQDYLNFFCLGNREAEDTCSSSGTFSASNPQVRLQVGVLFSTADCGALASGQAAGCIFLKKKNKERIQYAEFMFLALSQLVQSIRTNLGRTGDSWFMCTRKE